MNKKPALLLISSRSDTGGGPKHMYELMKTLSESGNYRLFCASPIDPPFGKLFRELSQEFIPLPARSFSVLSFIRLLMLIAKEDIRVIHSHGRGAGLFSRLLRVSGAKVVHTFHGIHLEQTFTGKIKFLTDSYLDPFADDYIFVSEDEKSRAISIGLGRSARLHVINNGIRTTSRSKPYPQNAIIGTLGRLTKVKGIDILMKAFQRLKEDFGYKQLSFKIAGDGEEKQTLELLKSQLESHESIEFLGEVSDPFHFLEELSLYASGSISEGQPLSVLEAMSLEVPCLLSKVTGHNTFIKAGVAWGWESEMDFSQKALVLLNDPIEAQKLTIKAKEYLRTHHSHEEQVAKTVRVYFDDKIL